MSGVLHRDLVTTSRDGCRGGGRRPREERRAQQGKWGRSEGSRAAAARGGVRAWALGPRGERGNRPGLAAGGAAQAEGRTPTHSTETSGIMKASGRPAASGRAGASSSAVPGAEPEEPPGSRTAAPGLLKCRRCRYLRTGRASCQAVQALLALLALVCGSVSCGPPGGYTGLPDAGGIYYYQYGGAYSGFSGAEGERAQQLDQRFHLLKLPAGRAAMAAGGALLLFSCLLVLVGVLRLPWHFPAWLLLECILDTVIAVGMVPALYRFFSFLLGVYNSPLCKERELLYQSKGYQGFKCSLHGAEIAAGLLGCAAGMAYLLGAGLAARAYRTVHKLKQNPEQLYEV
ncbi:MARVEL domain-containing protein 3 [Falco peregrinus]|uniref:MARVEL domain-containing protein 3 n=1 Tax=Falco peregrinus TaxID=8954 RepID=UPI00247922D9|nr:MARVEL domain-containing protein 3 [Falco peregrinus]